MRTPISRTLVIVLAFVAGGIRLVQGALPEAGGLFALGAGLVLLQLGRTKPALKPYAFLAFLVTALVLGAVLIRAYFS